MNKGMRYRIYPTKEQKVILEKHFGSCRFIYNKFLNIRQLMYGNFHSSISKTFLDKHILVFKEIYPWLKEVNSQSLQQANKNLDTAYQRFFKGLGGYPQIKKKKDNNSFQVTQRYSINLATSQLYIPNAGWIKIKIHRKLFEGINFGENIIEHDSHSDFLRTLTVSRTPARKYYVSILVDDQIETPPTEPYNKATLLGVDVGIKTFAACSDGTKIDNPKYLKASLQRLKCLQRRVSRKVLGSNNRRKAVNKLAKIHEKISNQRHDFQHKVSLQLIRENQAIAVETLNIQGMQKNHKLAQAVSDSSWYSFVSKLSYKAQWYGKTVLRIGQWEPSSKTCHVCGYKNKELKLKDREWLCPDCGTNHDRDINAAINIRIFALMEHEVELVDPLPLGKGMKQEAPRL